MKQEKRMSTKFLSPLLSLFTLIGMVFGGIAYADQKYVLQSEEDVRESIERIEDAEIRQAMYMQSQTHAYDICAINANMLLGELSIYDEMRDAGEPLSSADTRKMKFLEEQLKENEECAADTLKTIKASGLEMQIITKDDAK